MKAFDVTLKGYDGGTDVTDHLVKWVKAPDENALDIWLKVTGLEDHLYDRPRRMPEYDDIGFRDGIALYLDAKGTIMRTSASLAGITNISAHWIQESKTTLALKKKSA